MANERLCMGCMQPVSEFSENCYHCGYPVAGENPDGYLRVRTPLSDRYIVGRALEQRSDAIVYVGYDKVLKSAVLVREFFPKGLSARTADGQVRAVAGKEVEFDDCFEKFRSQARVIARMRDLPAMLPVYDLFEQGGTMYTIAEQVEGIPFRRYVQQLGGHLRWEEARPLLVPLISSLISLHAAGLYHLGISPDTLLIDTDNRLRLDGWELPQARMNGSSLEARLPAGYAAPEQYDGQLLAGQAADVYGLGATILYALTGEEPPTALDRLNKVASLLVPANLADQWPSYIAPTLCEALTLDATLRIPTMEQFRDRLTVAPVVEALRQQEEEPLSATGKAGDRLDQLTSYEPPKRKKNGYKAAVITLIAVCVLLAGAIAWLLLCGNPFNQNAQATDATVSTTTTVATKSTVSQFAVDDVVGQAYVALKDMVLNGNMSVKVTGKQYSDTVPKGTVISQEPMPETYADMNSVIAVVLSDGPEQKPLASLAGWDRVAARVYLEAMGYQVQEVEVTVSVYEKGKVDNTSPAAGTALTEGDVVVLQVSNVTTTTAAPTTTTATYATAHAGYSYATTTRAQ